MSVHITLASGSSIRAAMLSQAKIDHSVIKPRIDEDSVKASMLAENASPRDIADCLAEMKAQKVSLKAPGGLVLGSDQVLDHKGQIFSKPTDPDEACQHLHLLSGSRHQLLSAAVICEDGKPVWRHIGKVTLTMRALTDGFIDKYVARNWDSIRHSVGGYKLEEEGVRLFSRIDGDYFTVLGMPLLDIVNYLVLRGDLES